MFKHFCDSFYICIERYPNQYHENISPSLLELLLRYQGIKVWERNESFGQFHQSSTVFENHANGNFISSR